MATTTRVAKDNERGFTYINHRKGQKSTVSKLGAIVNESQICQAWYLWTCLTTIPVLVLVSAKIRHIWREEIWNMSLWDDMTTNYNLVSLLSFLVLFFFGLYACFVSYPRPIYLVEFACYKPRDDLKVTKDEFIELIRSSGKLNEESLEFQERILRSSGIGDETYVPKCISSRENIKTMKQGRIEASEVIFGALDELFEKTRINPKDVGIIVVNCSVFNPLPSLSSMIINHYKMRGNIMSFNLGGMGCSAGIISLDLARDLLHANPNNYALVVSTEMVAYNWYPGQNRSMLIPNCFFRMGCSAVLLSNRLCDHSLAKYRLEHLVHTHKGFDDRAFRSVYQLEDEASLKGLKVSKYVMEIGLDALKTNITNLRLLVLPFSERLISLTTRLVQQYLISIPMTPSKKTDKPYILGIDHFCVQASSKAVLDELQGRLDLTERNMEASKATMHRFGNTSSSSIWYVLAYLEAKERVRRGDRVWQLAFGSGFKCNSVVWRAMNEVKPPMSRNNPWMESIDSYPAAMN